MKVLLLSTVPRTFPGHPEARAMLEEAGYELVDPGARVVPEDEVDALISDVVGVIIGGTHPLKARSIRKGTLVKAIVREGIGTEKIDVDCATELGIPVSNTPGSNADSVADHTIALILALYRNLLRYDPLTREGNGWVDRQPLQQLTEKTVGVIGTSYVGSGVVRRLSGFGARVLAVDLVRNQRLVEDYDVQYVELERLLQESDVVTLHVPLTPATRNLIGARELSMMQRSAILINTARGEVVDEAALADALANGRLAGAGIDAWWTEPARESPLFALPNVVLTPHLGGNSTVSSRNARAWGVRNLLEALEGHPRDVVNGSIVADSR